MNRKVYIKLIPFIICVALVVASMIHVWVQPPFQNADGVTVHYSLPMTVIYAAFGLLIVLIFILQRKSYWVHALAILLVIALTPLIQFQSYTIFIGFAFIRFELVSAGILILHLVINKEVLNAIFRKNLDEETLLERERVKAEEFEKMITIYVNKFSSKERVELESIVNENSLRPEAVEAARRLLDSTN